MDISSERKRLLLELKALTEICEHENQEIVFDGCSSIEDSPWAMRKCIDCHKIWTEYKREPVE